MMMMRMPSQQEAIDWAKERAQTLAAKRDQENLYLLVLLHLIKQQEEELYEYRKRRYENHA